MVDDCLQTSAAHIYAAGDAAELHGLARDCRWVNALWPEAASQGLAAGYNLAGSRVVYPGSLSRNVMRVFDLDVLTVGNANPRDENGFDTVSTGGSAGRFYRRLVMKEDLLVGAVLIGDIEQGGLLGALTGNRTPLRLGLDSRGVG